LDLLDHQERLDHQENQGHLDHRVCLVKLEDTEKWEKRDPLDHLGLVERLDQQAPLVFQASQEKEDCLDYLVCQD
jgi:hypothetical protein